MIKNRNYQYLVRFLTLIGGIGGFFFSFTNLYHIIDVIELINIEGFTYIIINCIGMIFAEIVMLFSIRPNKPIPIHFVLIGIMGFLIMIFSYFWCGFLLLIGGGIDLITRTGGKE